MSPRLPWPIVSLAAALVLTAVAPGLRAQPTDAVPDDEAPVTEATPVPEERAATAPAPRPERPAPRGRRIDPGVRPPAPDRPERVVHDPYAPARVTRPAAEAPVSAADVRGLPRPNEANGLARGPGVGPEVAVWVPRTVFLVPRLAAMLVFAPVRSAAYVNDKYSVDERYLRIFFNEERTAGILPAGSIDTDFGVTVGVRAVHKDLFGRQERASLRASYGGRYRQGYELEAESGSRFDPFFVGAKVEVDARPKERFFGIGNNDELEVAEVTEPADPLAVAVDTRYRRRAAGGGLGAGVRLSPYLRAGVAGGYRWLSFGEPSDLSSDQVALEEVYATEDLVGFDEGVSNFFAQLEVRYDSLKNPNPYAPLPLPARGWRAGAFAGYAYGVGDDPSRYLRYGADIQRFFDLYDGTRILSLRAVVEGVAGDRDEIPFVDLPSLGGDRFLRGYEFDRFRDRLIGLASAEYMIELGEYVAGYFFADVGRPWESWGDLSLDDPRLGFGVGLQAHTLNAFLARGQIASSIDGGLFLNLVLAPSWTPRPVQPEP